MFLLIQSYMGISYEAKGFVTLQLDGKTDSLLMRFDLCQWLKVWSDLEDS